MAPPKKDTDQVTLRVQNDVLAEAERLSARSQGSAHPWSRNDVLRAAMVYGLASVSRAIASQTPPEGDA